MRYEMRDLKTGRTVQATREQRDLLLKIGRAEDVVEAEPHSEAEPDTTADDSEGEAPQPAKKAAKKAAKKRAYKRRDMQAED